MSSLNPREAMLLAIEEGKKGAGFVSPNPLVGCVILDRDFNLLSKGFHARVGEGHAEVEALRAVKDSSRLEGAHIFVTLEPCAHEGRTPSCAKALAKLPIASVTYGLKDPNPLVSGKGAEILMQAGKSVTLFEGLQAELEELCEIFLLNLRAGRPFVALKAAVTLDGKVARADGTSKWITGETSRENVHYLRGCYDAVLAGVGTFLKDDPKLNVRDSRFEKKRQRVVLLDPEGKCFAKLSESSLLKVHAPENILIVTSSRAKPPAAVEILPAIARNGEFALAEVLVQLREKGIHSLFVEGGAFTYASFLKQKLADRLYLYVAPKIFGEGLSWLSASSIAAPSLTNLRTEKFDDDILFTGRFAWSKS